MRKKFIKSSRPTYKKRIKKAQQGMRFVSYNPVSNPTIDYTDITNPINPFSEYNYNTTYDKPTALVVPVRDTDETDVVANNHTVEPVINKSVASKPVTDKPVTANSTWKSPYTNRRQWTTELINAYKRAGITNDNAIRMLLAQDALESSWGKSAQGKYNFGNLTTGSSWKGDYVTGNDKNAKGEAIKQKFRSYNSMDEYAADKIQFLKRLYDFDENDDINKFVAKLTGSNKGKRRYAEATNYAKVLTGVYNGIPKGENGMIIKYQNPPHGIARRDAIQDYRPEIPFSPIKQPVKPYMPTQQPILSPDNRTGWEKEVSRQIKADRAKNDNLYGNQHTWNWSAPFTNARITKDNASAMFDFDKSAAMSTFAIGQGIASPVTTATSIAGSLVGAGIGNKVAGEKGALVGGFVGGLLGDRTLNAVRHAKNTNKNIGVVSEYYKNPDNPLLSEVDWRGWSKGGEISKEHLAEYAAIERAAKANDTWLKTRDGEPWKGDKRTWIQLMSKDGEKFRHGEFPSNRDIWYNGVPDDGTMLRDYPTYTGDTWLADRYEAALPYSKTMKGQVFHIGVPKGTRIKGFDAHGDKFSEVRLPDGTRMKTDRIVDEVKATGKYDATYIKDVDETWGFKPNDDLILHSGTPRKSLIGNNGDFDLSNPNIYKTLMPFLIGGTTYGFNGRNVDKQTTKKND
ncbi:glucosaminidase domain-containing protein [Bacteroides xylanisolvens]|uniref:glucosaminidase domain-containing protein n=1 Tax=Bacteroides xylanisolvens TaxID=371601 RepID=UPI0039B6C6F8